MRWVCARWGAAGLALAVLVLGCDRESKSVSREEKPSSGEPPAASVPVGALVNPEIAEAVAVAADDPPPRADDNAPPPDGILGKLKADAEAPENAPAKVVLGQAGSDPKVRLGGPDVTEERIGQLSVSVRMGPTAALPTVDFRFELAGKALEPGSAGPADHELTLGVSEAKLGREQPGQLPKELADLIGGMKGSRYTSRFAGGARLGEFNVELGKGTDPQLKTLLNAAADSLTSILLAYPKEPVGTGGFWMVTTREQLSMAEVVSYRLVRVDGIEGARVTLSVTTKRYLVTDTFQGVPALQFQGMGSGEIVVTPGEPLPLEGKVQETLAAVIQQSGHPPQPIQLEARALFAFPPKEPAPKEPAQKETETAAPKTP